MYLLERIKESKDWPKGARIWSDTRIKGWRVVDVRSKEYFNNR